MDEFDERVAAQLGRRVRRRRRFLDLSQEALAGRAAIPRSQISLYENGRRLPGAGSLVRLMAALEVSADQLLGGVGRQVPGAPLADPDEDVGGDPDVGPPDGVDDA